MSGTSGILGSEVQVVGLRGKGTQYKGRDYKETISGAKSEELGSGFRLTILSVGTGRLVSRMSLVLHVVHPPLLFQLLSSLQQLPLLYFHLF